MVHKNKSKKRSVNFNPIKLKQVENSLKSGISDEMNIFTEDMKLTLKEMAFSSLSNKQFRKLGLVPEVKPVKQTDTIALRFPAKLMPTFRKIFRFDKITDKEKLGNSTVNDNLEKSYVTLISFQSFIHDGHQTKLTNLHLPTLQITQLPLTKDMKNISLTLSESNIKLENVPDLLYKSKETRIDHEKSSVIKLTKKRSFFNDIWRKKSTIIVESPPPPPIDQPPEPNIRVPVSQNDYNICISCEKQAFIAERIQIGTDVFHNSCFKCIHCFKCLYRGKWNKHQNQYYCDYCYKRLMWPFIRR